MTQLDLSAVAGVFNLEDWQALDRQLKASDQVGMLQSDTFYIFTEEEIRALQRRILR